MARKYRGYYIDKVIFNSKADIDAHIKNRAIDSYKQAVISFCNHPTMENSIWCDDKAGILHTECGMDWTEIEELEIKVMESIA